MTHYMLKVGLVEKKLARKKGEPESSPLIPPM